MAGRMGGSWATVVAFGAVVVVGLGCVWASQPSSDNAAPLAVPSFATATQSAAVSSVPPRPTLLPTDCAEVLPGHTDMAALLGKPNGSVGVRTVVGQPSVSVAQLERLTCNYQPPGGPASGLVLTLTAFTDPPSAAAQRDRNVAAERDARASSPAALGAARATLLTEPDRRLLLVSYDRYTLSLGIAPGVVADDQVEQVLTDLAQRVLPGLPPSPNQH